jgi:hypothetical protein
MAKEMILYEVKTMCSAAGVINLMLKQLHGRNIVYGTPCT